MSTNRFNPSTIIGVLASLALLAVILFFAAADPWMYVNLPGLAIVIGGTLAATFISYPMREVVRIFRLLGAVFRDERVYSQADIDELVNLARLWMSNDIRKVEAALQNVSNSFLRAGVQLVIDHTPEEQIAEYLQWRVARLREKEYAEAQLFRTMASYAPAFGMLGTLVGLINLLSVLGDASITVIGEQMAIALMTTFYGVLLANLVCKPVAVKLERRTEQRVVFMNMVMQGISMMSEKRSPAMVRETLLSFMPHDHDEIDLPSKQKNHGKGFESSSASAPDASR